MTEKKREYIVTRRNTLDYEVGDRVELTDHQAARLVNKVRPADEFAPRQSDDESAKALEAKDAELAQLRTQLDESAKALEAKDAELKTVTDELNDLKLAAMTGTGDQGSKGGKK